MMKISSQNLSELSFKALDGLPEPVFWFDKNGQFIDVNEEASLHWGYSKDEFLTMSIFDVNPNMKRETWQDHWEAKQHDPSTFESTHQRKDGTIFPVDITDNFVSVNGNIYCCAIIRDITARKELDRIARLSDFTVQKAGDAIFWMNDQGRILHVNQLVLSRYGYTKAELLNMHILDISKNISKETFRGIWKTLQTEKQLIVEGQHFTKEGKIIQVEISANFLSFEGSEYVCSMVRDITDRKRKEAALRGALLEIRELKEKLEAENNYLSEEIEVKNSVGNIITDSTLYKQVLKRIEQVSETSSTVLISGESGTGKSLLARAIHQLSDRSERPMINIDCAALPNHMIESELFGHEKGAFPGAISRKIGKFELADNGTLFFNKIGELPFDLQAKLLRVIQGGEFERLGGPFRTTVDVRIIASTNKDLTKEIEEGRFREDLYYLLNVFPIESIPLRKRKEDIPLLLKYFATQIGIKMGRQITHIPQNLVDALMKYDFPGNVRELENLIERGVITSKKGKLNVSDFNLKQKRVKTKSFMSLEEYQKQYIAEVLKHTQWRVSGDKGAALILGMRPTTLFSKIEKLGLKRSTDVHFE